MTGSDARGAEAAYGRADLHVHSVASDGTASVVEILEWVEAVGTLDLVAITDHERIDAALAARRLARARRMRVEVIVGEEVTTRGGHLLALFIEEQVRPLQSLQETIGQVHELGGIAIPAHPLTPLPGCASARTLRRLIEGGDPRVRPDALEAFNPTPVGRYGHRRVRAFLAEHAIAGTGSSDAHELRQVGQGHTLFLGRTADDLRAALEERSTSWDGVFDGTRAQVGTFAKQLRKYSRDVRAEVRGAVVRVRGGERTGRDLGYPGGHLRPPRLFLPDDLETEP